MNTSAQFFSGSAPAHSDALVIFGFSGVPAAKKIFPALYAMVKKGVLSVPVIGITSSRSIPRFSRAH